MARNNRPELQLGIIMFKRLIDKLPTQDELKRYKFLKIFGDSLYHPVLWSYDRHSVAKAFAVGLMCAWIPVPFQMILSAVLAIFFGCNVPIAVALVWFTNPVTMPFLFPFAYLVGAKILGYPLITFRFEASWEWLVELTGQIFVPFISGCFLLGFIFAIVSYLLVYSIWREKTD